ncbi:DinB family protein [Gymnodinialimonas sp. 2305UL16-5]|uniref:DinB family protein n=1 Tax=Gymnodinialimonas mytili TaxID=3126503 RepID=UPI0030B59423
MIGPDYARHMARYNAWQNHWMFAASDKLSDAQRTQDRGAFFGSIQATLSHLAWGDQIWTARFDGGPGPDTSLAESHDAYAWDVLMTLRPQLDARIAAWAWSTEQSDFEGDLTFTPSSTGIPKTLPKAICIAQLFNHQTHHRGQVHAMLTALGVKTDVTDLPFMPDEVPEWD